MNLPKSLNAKTKVRDMILVDCATDAMDVDHVLKELRTQRIKSFWGMVAQLMILLALFLLLIMKDLNLFAVSYVPALLLGLQAYYWVASDSKIQLLLLIKHYREED
jgi:hypothetical protein